MDNEAGHKRKEFTQKSKSTIKNIGGGVKNFWYNWFGDIKFRYINPQFLGRYLFNYFDKRYPIDEINRSNTNWFMRCITLIPILIIAGFVILMISILLFASFIEILQIIYDSIF